MKEYEIEGSFMFFTNQIEPKSNHNCSGDCACSVVLLKCLTAAAAQASPVVIFLTSVEKIELQIKVVKFT